MQIIILKKDNLFFIEHEKFDIETPKIYYLYRVNFIGRFKFVKKFKNWAKYEYAPALDKVEYGTY